MKNFTLVAAGLMMALTTTAGVQTRILGSATLQQHKTNRASIQILDLGIPKAVENIHSTLAKRSNAKNTASAQEISGDYLFALGDYYNGQESANDIDVPGEIYMDGDFTVLEWDFSPYLPAVGEYNEATGELEFYDINLGLYNFQGGEQYYIFCMPTVWDWDEEKVFLAGSYSAPYNESTETFEFPIDHGFAWMATTDEEGQDIVGQLYVLDVIGAVKEKPDTNWVDYDTAYYVDGWVMPSFGVNPEDYGWDVSVQQNVENPNLFRLDNPYNAPDTPIPGYAQRGGYIMFDISDPLHVPVSADVWCGLTLQGGAQVMNTNMYGYMISQYGDQFSAEEMIEYLDSEGFLFSTYENGYVNFQECRFQIDGSEPYIWSEETFNLMNGYLRFNNKSPNPVKPLPAPSVNIDGNSVSISGNEPGATYHYGIDTSDKSKMVVYTAPFEPGKDCTIYAYASKEGYQDSEIVQTKFVMPVYIKPFDQDVTAYIFADNESNKRIAEPIKCTIWYEDGVFEIDPFCNADDATLSFKINSDLKEGWNDDVELCGDYLVFPNKDKGDYSISHLEDPDNFFLGNLVIIRLYGYNGNPADRMTELFEPSFDMNENHCRVFKDPADLHNQNLILQIPFYAYRSRNEIGTAPSKDWMYLTIPFSTTKIEPSILPSPSIKIDGAKVTISGSESGATYHYGIDTSDRTKMTEYKGTFEPGRNCTVYAYASKDGWVDSEIAKSDTITSYVVTKPTITTDGYHIVINKNETSDAVKTFYRLDGKTPTNGAADGNFEYKEPFTLSNDAVIKAKSFRDGYTPAESDPFTYTHSVYVTAKPTLTLSADKRKVALGGSGNGASYFYNMEGENAAKWEPYANEIAPGKNCTVFAKAQIDGKYESAVDSIRVTGYKVATPTITVTGRKVSIGGSESGAKYFYSIDTDKPDTWAEYTAEFEPGRNCTVYAYATFDGWDDSDISVSASVASYKVTTPTITVTGRKVSIGGSEPGAKYFYSIDTDKPETWTEYTAEIEPGRNCTVYAYATLDGWNDSEISAPTAIDSYTVTTPTITVMDRKVSIGGSESGAKYFYSIGTDQPESWTEYTSEFEPGRNCTIYAYAAMDGWNDSEIAAPATVNSYTVTTPTVSATDRKVSIGGSESGAKYFYSIDTDKPDTWTEYTAEFEPGRNCIVFAYATLDGWNDSEISAPAEVIGYITPRPTIRKVDYYIHIDKNDDNPELVRTYYTTDGSTPTEASAEYTEPFRLGDDCIVIARSFREGYTPSEVDQFTYRVADDVAPRPEIHVDGRNVTIGIEGDGFTYSYNLVSADAAEWSAYAGPFEPGRNCTVYAKAEKEGMYPSPIASATVDGYTVTAPTLTIASDGKTITIGGSETGAKYFYGINTSDKAAMTEFSAEFEPGRNCTVYAYAALTDWHDSSVAASDSITAYVLDKPVVEMQGYLIGINSNGGVEGVETFYTTDNTLPDRGSTRYSGPFELHQDGVIIAVSYKEGWTESVSDPFTYTYASCVTPTPNIIDLGDRIEIDGSEVEGSDVAPSYLYRLGPVGDMQPYTGAIPLDYNEDVYAMARMEGRYDSEVRRHEVKNRRTAAPALKSFDKDAGRVTLECETAQSSIHYRIGDVGDFTLYGAYIPVSGNETIWAYATSARRLDSDTIPITISEFTVEAPAFSGYDGRNVTISWSDASAKVTCQLAGETFTATNGQRIDLKGLNTVTATARKEGHSDASADFTAQFYSDTTRVLTTVPGQVQSALSWREKFDADTLWVQGRLNAADFDAIRRFKDLTKLNLTNVTDASLPNGAFAGMSALRHLTMPASLTSNEGILFGDNDLLSSVTFTGLAETMPDGLLDGIDTPNLLLYVRRSAYADAVADRFPNIVYGGKADRLVLADTHPFDCPTPFTAKEATYTKDFTKKTVLGECSGWEAVVLPFDATEFRHADKGAVMPFAAPGSGSDLRFWLFGREGEEWTPTASMEADAPYLVSMPNSGQYDESCNLPGAVTFTGRDVAVPVTDLTGKTASILSTDLIVPTYGFVPMTPYMQAVNDHDLSLDGDDYLAGGAYLGLNKGQSRDIRPFEWYIRTSAPNKSPRPILGSSEVAKLLAETSIEVWTEGHAVCVLTGSAREVRVHDLAGQLVCVLRAEPGQTARTAPLTPGIYFAAGRKLLVK